MKNNLQLDDGNLEPGANSTLEINNVDGVEYIETYVDGEYSSSVPFPLNEEGADKIIDYLQNAFKKA